MADNIVQPELEIVGPLLGPATMKTYCGWVCKPRFPRNDSGTLDITKREVGK